MGPVSWLARSVLDGSDRVAWIHSSILESRVVASSSASPRSDSSRVMTPSTESAVDAFLRSCCARDFGTLAVTLAFAVVGCHRASNPSTMLDQSTPTKTMARVSVASASGPVASASTESGKLEWGSAREANGIPRAVVGRYNYCIDFGPYGFQVDAVNGARIIEFSFEGRSVVIPAEESPESYGSTFWLSPQSDWNWPPPLELDAAEWAVNIDGDQLILESRIIEKLLLRVEQRIRADRKHEAIKFEYEIYNTSKVPRRAAGWQNSRVRPLGLTFFPADTPSMPSKKFEALMIEPKDGVSWLAHEPKVSPESRKLFANGHEGWLAHLDGDLLFVKVFPDILPSQQAPEEGEIDVYVHKSGRFVEMEQQGPYEEIAPGRSSTWTVYWLVRRVPKGVPLEAGSDKLVQFARQIAQGVRADR